MSVGGEVDDTIGSGREEEEEGEGEGGGGWYSGVVWLNKSVRVCNHANKYFHFRRVRFNGF